MDPPSHFRTSFAATLSLTEDADIPVDALAAALRNRSDRAALERARKHIGSEPALATESYTSKTRLN